MAAPEGVAPLGAYSTTWPPTGSAPHALPSGHRKFPFETQAADQVGGAAVAGEHLPNQSYEGCEQERQAPRVQPSRLVTMTSVIKTVYTLQPPSVLSGGLPADTQTRATSKSLLPIKSKEVDVSRLPHSGGSENDVTKVIKPRRENGQVKAADPAIKRNVRKGYKPVSKQKSEEELKDKNQLLEAVNKQLHQKLTETQGELKDLTQKVELLEKFQDSCLAILESKGLSPVSGSETLAADQEATTDHVNSMALKVKLKMKEEERAKFLEQQTLCNSQVNDFTAALEEMEQLLEM
ncbi:small kinetochore-associated protein isoform X3 [Equus asinus]|uniref:Kinetochore localized astrin (SPAG5) binding protein n=1 Tax=Equus asinus TaxID=9793 RepID=A0A8C4MAD1_EQUAS